jgi:hypothetical protein
MFHFYHRVVHDRDEIDERRKKKPKKVVAAVEEEDDDSVDDRGYGL